MIERLRRLARSAIAWTLYYSGALWLVARSRLSEGAIVLMYHRVLPADADTFSSDSIIVTPETFARHMRFLKRHFWLLSMQELAQAYAEGRALPPMSCVVTFDDGWFDNHRYALPILREYEVPAVVFAATDFIGGDRCFWQERLARMFCLATRSGGEPARLAAAYTGADISSRPDAQRRELALAAVARLKPRGSAAIATIETELRTAMEAAGIELGCGDDRFMNWEELAVLSRDPNVTVGSHCRSHAPLTSLDSDSAEAELTGARSLLERKLGRPVDTVGYPNGSYDDRVVNLARAARYRLGFTTDKGTISIADDPLRLRRVNIGEPTTRTAPDLLCTMLLVFDRFRRPTPAPAHARPRH